MEVLEIKENDDGSAVLTIETNKEENDLLVEKAVVDILREDLLEEHLVSITDAQNEIFKFCYAHHKGLTSINGLDNDGDFEYWKDNIRDMMWCE